MTTSNLMTRKDCLDQNTVSEDTFALHRRYYAQFTTPSLQQAVVARFGLPELAKAFKADKHLNGIPLAQWDCMQPYTSSECGRALRAAGDSPSLANAVCLLKEAARQAVEDFWDRETDR